MKIKIHNKNLEKGQILPMIVFGMVALMGMAALILDGAIIMSHRRTAQAAADAAALAGAEHLCPTDDDDYDMDEAEKDAILYAGLNNAVIVSPVTFPDASTIHVETTVESDSFFAKIFDQQLLTASAVAEAKCSPLDTGHGTMPVAFPCDTEGESKKCHVDYYDDNYDDDWNIAHDRMYILVDSEPTEEQCALDGVQCENILSMNARGWVNLGGEEAIVKNDNCSTSKLESWIDESVAPPDIYEGYWLSKCVAKADTIYKTLSGLVPKNFRVPIYNKQCSETYPGDEYKCEDTWEDGDNDSLVFKGSNLNYRIVAFGLFRMTCVKDKNADTCPYRTYLEGKGVLDTSGNSVGSVEGYFIQGTFPSGGGGEFNHGLFVVHLIQ